ncbi:DUF3231 family protein [Paenibacillus sp. GCM10027628]|uniref:DUF3231 family protein n=1 Tax=Paenibacillus sp. GCM10027628 TaxID=3273413 RepID=UPI003630BB26
MDTLTTSQTATKDKLTVSEIGKLWVTYAGNSMAVCVLRYFLQHIEDQEIKKVVEKGLQLSEQFVQSIKDIFPKRIILCQ